MKNKYKKLKTYSKLIISHRDGEITVKMDADLIDNVTKHDWRARIDNGSPRIFTKVHKNGGTKELQLSKYIVSRSRKKGYDKIKRVLKKNGDGTDLRMENLEVKI